MIVANQIAFVLETMDCKPSILASILGMSPKTLHDLYSASCNNHIITDNRITDNRVERLEKLYLFCKAAKACSIESKYMLNLLNEPLFGEDTESWLDLINRSNDE